MRIFAAIAPDSDSDSWKASAPPSERRSEMDIAALFDYAVIITVTAFALICGICSAIEEWKIRRELK